MQQKIQNNSYIYHIKSCRTTAIVYMSMQINVHSSTKVKLSCINSVNNSSQTIGATVILFREGVTMTLFRRRSRGPISSWI